MKLKLYSRILLLVRWKSLILKRKGLNERNRLMNRLLMRADSEKRWIWQMILLSQQLNLILT
ncbi:MAG: hypothetical protein CMF72_26010 [Mameliella sp.]|nr:hypothetical protein [Mameliella sp.]